MQYPLAIGAGWDSTISVTALTNYMPYVSVTAKGDSSEQSRICPASYEDSLLV